MPRLMFELPADVADEVRWHIERVGREWAHHPMQVGEIASRLHVLPLSLDMGGFTALGTDGRVVAIVWDEPTTERPVDSARERDIALYIGSERYPVLARLLPERQPTSKACTVCGGTGKHPVAAEAGIENLVCSCGGLGWIPGDWE